MKNKIILLMLSSTFLLSFSSNVFAYPNIKKISYRDTSLLDLFVEQERIFKEALPYLYFEKINENLEINEIDNFFKVISKNDITLCIENMPKLKNFCNFYEMLMQNKSFHTNLWDDKDLTPFVMFDISLRYAKDGDFKKAVEIALSIDDHMLTSFFSKYFYVIKGVNDEETVSNSNKYFYLACLFSFFKDGHICKLENDSDFLGYLDFFQGEKHFLEKNYLSASLYFFKALKNHKIHKTALENAVYAFFLDNDLDRALELAKLHSKEFYEKIKYLVHIERGTVSYDVPEEILKEDGFNSFFLKNLKSYFKKGKDLKFLKNINIKHFNGEPLFWLCCAKIIIDEEEKAFNKYCSNLSWEDSFFEALFQMVFSWKKGQYTYDKLDDKVINEKMLEETGLANYWPFNFFAAELAYENKNYLKALEMYENLLRYPKKFKTFDIEVINLRMAMIYKKKESYYTAKKYLEKNFDKVSNIIIDKSKVDYVKVLIEEGKYQESIMYAEHFEKEIKDKNLKKELQNLIEMSYEQLEKQVSGGSKRDD